VIYIVRKSKALKDSINKLREFIMDSGCLPVNLKGDKLSYNLKHDYIRDISKYNQNVLGELGRAIAVIDLIQNRGVPPQSLLLEEKSIVGSPSRRLDLKLEIGDVYNGRNCIALVECKTSIRDIEDSFFTTYFKRQLLNIAHSYARDRLQPFPLVLIAYEITSTKGKEVKVLYKWFYYPEIEKTIETGQISLDEIISKSSSFAYDYSPEVHEGKVYFIKKPITKKELIDIKDQNELKKLLKEKLHQKLRNYGVVEEKAFQTILNLLLAKTYDEIELERDQNKEPGFQVKPEDYINEKAFYNRIKSLLENALIELLNEDPKEASEIEILDSEDKEKILLDIVPYIQRIRLRSLRFLGEDTMGDIFLDFMHSIFRQSRGLFFTHPLICRFVCKAVGIEGIRDQVREGNYRYILDPSCGSGTFLIEALRILFKDFSIEEIRKNALKILFGIDNEPRATTLCKVNMVIHGDGSANIYTRNALMPLSTLPLQFIKEKNILRSSQATFESLKENHGVDFIITNPPFSLEIRADQYNHFRIKDFLTFKKGVSTASECLFVERWFQLLNPRGRIGAVMPFSFFDSAEYYRARLLFLCYFKIVSIVGLPEHAFSPHAQQRTVLVFAERRDLKEADNLYKLINSPAELIKALEDEKIIFYDAKDIGFIRSKRRKSINTQITENNELSDDLAALISDAFEGIYRDEPKVMIKSIKEIYNENQSIKLTPNFSSTLEKSEFFTLSEEWEIVKVEKVDLENLELNNLKVCETGDITPGGSGIITPTSLQHTTPSNKERIRKKLRAGKFGKLYEGDVIIAPVRVYQKKVAVVTNSASKFLFSKDFIVLRRKVKNLKQSFILFLNLTKDYNTMLLENLSSTGKKGYPKINHPEAILSLKFARAELTEEEIEILVELYENIYRHIMK
jgi:hypothetical protein